MTSLSVLLATKILVTLVAVVAPFLLLPKARLDTLAGFGAPNLAMYRLYGMAILALVVAYSGGFIATLSGRYPTEVVAMGLASNVGAAAIMLATGYAKSQKILTGFFGLVGLAFIGAAAFPETWMLPVL